MSRYVRATLVDEIPPGSGKALALDGHEIALFNLGGEFFAIENTCPHRGGSLGAGEVEGEEVLCPLHGWAFNIRTGRMPMDAGGVKTFAVRVEGDEVLVEI